MSNFVEEVESEAVETEAPAAEAPVKKKRTRKVEVDDAGEPVAKAPKAPKAPKEPKLDENGNPIAVVRKRVIPNNEATIIRVSEEQAQKLANYKGQRHDQAVMIRDGMTLGEFYQENGDRGFLAFYVRDGAVSLEQAS